MRLFLSAVALVLASALASAEDAPSPSDAPAPVAPPVAVVPPAPPPVAPPPAVANEAARKPKTSEIVRFVPSAEEAVVSMGAVINPDCSSAGKTVSRIVTPPQHGEVTFVYKKIFTTFSARLYEHCSEVEVPGMETHFKSAADFLGEDTMDVLYIYPNGNAQQIHFALEVK